MRGIERSGGLGNVVHEQSGPGTAQKETDKFEVRGLPAAPKNAAETVPAASWDAPEKVPVALLESHPYVTVDTKVALFREAKTLVDMEKPEEVQKGLDEQDALESAGVASKAYEGVKKGFEALRDMVVKEPAKVLGIISSGLASMGMMGAAFNNASSDQQRLAQTELTTKNYGQWERDRQLAENKFGLTGLASLVLGIGAVNASQTLYITTHQQASFYRGCLQHLRLEKQKQFEKERKAKEEEGVRL